MYPREREELEARMQILRSTVTEQATQLAQARAELETCRKGNEALVNVLAEKDEKLAETEEERIKYYDLGHNMSITLGLTQRELERANAKLEAVARDNLELTSGSLGIDPDVYRLAQEVVKSHNVRLAWEREARELLNELSNYADATGAEVCIRVDEFLKSGLPEKL